VKPKTSYIKLQFFLILTTFFCFTSVLAQNDNCNFNSTAYYLAFTMGTDKIAKQNAVNIVYKIIYEDYRLRFSLPAVNQILSRCNVVKTCINSNNQTTAYALKTAVRNCFTCQPNIEVHLNNIHDINIQDKIQNNTIDFLTELYCAYEQGTALKLAKFISSGCGRNNIEKLWDLNPFRCSDLILTSDIIELEGSYLVEHIPIIFKNPQDSKDEVWIFRPN